MDRLLVVDTSPELNTDVVVSQVVDMPGGAAGNVAAALGVLGQPTAIVSHVGDDEMGLMLKRNLMESRVQIDSLQTCHHQSTCRFTCVMTSAGRRTFYLENGCDAHFTAAIGSVEYANAASLIFNGLPIQHLTLALRTAADSNAPVFVNMGTLISGRELTANLELFRSATAAFLNRDELTAFQSYTRITEQDFIAICQDAGMSLVVTDGPRGSLTYHNGRQLSCPAKPCADLSNTLGCGDAFLAGWVAAYFEGGSPLECAALGHECASRVAAIHTERMPKFESAMRIRNTRCESKEISCV